MDSDCELAGLIMSKYPGESSTVQIVCKFSHYSFLTLAIYTMLITIILLLAADLLVNMYHMSKRKEERIDSD